MIVRSVSSMNSRDGNYIQGLEFYSSEKSEKLFSQWGAQIAMVHIMVSRVSSLISRAGNIHLYLKGLEFCASEKSEQMFIQVILQHGYTTCIYSIVSRVNIMNWSVGRIISHILLRALNFNQVRRLRSCFHNEMSPYQGEQSWYYEIRRRQNNIPYHNKGWELLSSDKCCSVWKKKYDNMRLQYNIDQMSEPS